MTGSLRLFDRNEKFASADAYAPPPFGEAASSEAARWSRFCGSVNERRGVGPARGPGLVLVMGLSSRRAINKGLDVVELADSRLCQTVDLL